MIDDSHDFVFKTIIVGDSGVGKTKITLRYIDNKFQVDTQSTIGVEFASKQLEIRNQRVKLQIWDTAGTERYKAVTTVYFQGARGALVVFDITSRSSFENIESWLKDIKRTACRDVKLMLIGNKSDMNEERAVSIEEIKEKAKDLG